MSGAPGPLVRQFYERKKIVPLNSENSCENMLHPSPRVNLVSLVRLGWKAFLDQR